LKLLRGKDRVIVSVHPSSVTTIGSGSSEVDMRHGLNDICRLAKLLPNASSRPFFTFRPGVGVVMRVVCIVTITTAEG
jgi:hypothetical protein